MEEVEEDMEKEIKKSKGIGQETDDQYYTDLIGYNLRQFRLMRGWSLEEVADKTGVSVSMISQIERGIRNPTIAIVIRICNGMNISLNQLLCKNNKQVEVVRRGEMKSIGGEEIQMLFMQDVNNPFSISTNHLSPHVQHEANGHGENVYEYVMVSKGTFTLILDGNKYTIGENESLKFPADRKHIYANETDEDLWIFNITLFGA